jgi:hypothetical protein
LPACQYNVSLTFRRLQRSRGSQTCTLWLALERSTSRPS